MIITRTNNIINIITNAYSSMPPEHKFKIRTEQTSERLVARDEQ